MNSQQIKINGKKYLAAIPVAKYSEMNIEFLCPKEKGVYELELFCEEYSLKEVYPVYSSNRFTIKVE